MDDFQRTLRRLTVRDDRFVASVLTSEEANAAASGLDAKTHALARLAALIAVDAAPQSYAACVDSAHEAGASDTEIVGTLIAALPVVGAPRVVSAAPKLGLALGYDLDAAMESGNTLSA
jgi:4-carboxymuconolactone decarboxylase